jgi:hypothetical protein
MLEQARGFVAFASPRIAPGAGGQQDVARHLVLGQHGCHQQIAAEHELVGHGLELIAVRIVEPQGPEQGRLARSCLVDHIVLNIVHSAYWRATSAVPGA